jgi:hypothetical protein
MPAAGQGLAGKAILGMNEFAAWAAAHTAGEGNATRLLSPADKRLPFNRPKEISAGTESD